MPENVIILTLFIIVFSIVISWFKDLPDVEGDAQYNIKSFAILYSPRFVLITGNLLVAMAYIFTIAVKYAELFLSNVQNFETKVLFTDIFSC